MAATLHAIVFLALPILTIVLCRVFWKRPPKTKRAVAAVAAALPLFLLPGHLCDAGQATMQTLVGGICMVFVVTCATNRRIAVALGAAMAVATFCLVSHYDGLVHGSEFIGHSRSGMAAHRNRMTRLHDIRAELQARGGSPVAEGWISDHASLIGPGDPRARSWREYGESMWHSTFTWLFRRRRIPMEIWYPGGPPAEAAFRLEWRDRD
ncbi:MAG TPA: hypothetical protein VFC86_00175 [Planctomycetota bacterium]|nr:hypothetical protein [Planctomycetota bacterium]